MPLIQRNTRKSILYLILRWIGSQCSSFQAAVLLSYLPALVTTLAAMFWMRCICWSRAVASQCRECLRSLGVTAQVLMPLSWLQTVLGFYGWIWVFVSSQRLRDTFCWSWYWTRGSHPDRLPGVWCSYSSICLFRSHQVWQSRFYSVAEFTVSVTPEHPQNNRYEICGKGQVFFLDMLLLQAWLNPGVGHYSWIIVVLGTIVVT